MNIIACIPARLESSRFPNKPLEEILGMPMIGHVYLRTLQSELLSQTYVATCNEEIYNYILSIGGKAVMTSNKHEGCVDRCAEAMLKIEAETGKKTDILLLIQGDEPMIHPKMIELSLKPLIENPSISIANMMTEIKDDEEFEDPNEVKVVVDKNHDAIYFSREAIPSKKKFGRHKKRYKQTCIIPFRRDLLLNFQKMQRTPLEIIESIDMLRLLEEGVKIRMVPNPFNVYSVDTPEDLKKVEGLMKDDPLQRSYQKKRELAKNL